MNTKFTPVKKLPALEAFRRLVVIVCMEFRTIKNIDVLRKVLSIDKRMSIYAAKKPIFEIIPHRELVRMYKEKPEGIEKEKCMRIVPGRYQLDAGAVSRAIEWHNSRNGADPILTIKGRGRFYESEITPELAARWSCGAMSTISTFIRRLNLFSNIMLKIKNITTEQKAVMKRFIEQLNVMDREEMAGIVSDIRSAYVKNIL